jgi:hypothetical protein
MKTLSTTIAAGALMLAGACFAQTPGLPAAAEPTAPASRIGPPVPGVPVLSNTPLRTTPKTSGTLTLPRTPTDPTGTTVPPLTPASGTRG